MTKATYRNLPLVIHPRLLCHYNPRISEVKSFNPEGHLNLDWVNLDRPRLDREATVPLGMTTVTSQWQ